MCTVLLPPGVNPIAVNKYIIYHIIGFELMIIRLGWGIIAPRLGGLREWRSRWVCLLFVTWRQLVGVTEIQIIWSIDFIEKDNGVINMTTES